jgi:hypothetical protein
MSNVFMVIRQNSLEPWLNNKKIVPGRFTQIAICYFAPGPGMIGGITDRY